MGLLTSAVRPLLIFDNVSHLLLQQTNAWLTFQYPYRGKRASYACTIELYFAPKANKYEVIVNGCILGLSSLSLLYYNPSL